MFLHHGSRRSCVSVLTVLNFIYVYGYILILYVCAPLAFSALKNLKEGVRSSGTADSSHFKQACIDTIN